MKTATKPTLPAGLFGEDGKPLPSKVDRNKADLGQEPGYENSETLFFGLPIGSEEHHLIPPKSIIDTYQVDATKKHFKNVMKLFAKGYPLFLVGETGTGKTQIVKFCCASARKPLYQVQGHAHLEWEDLVGRFVLEGGESVFVPGPLFMAMKEEACFLLDECASVKQGILNGLNELANGGNLAVDNGKGHQIVERKPGFRIIMTANPWDNYAGNNELNIAYLDRFKVINFGYLDEKAEAKLLKSKYPTIEDGVIRNLCKFANNTRSAKEKNPDGIRYLVSTRTLQNICDLITDLRCTPLEAIEDAVYSIVRLVAFDEYRVIKALADAAMGSNVRKPTP